MKVTCWGFAFMCLFLNARADVAVLTQHNDLARTGANLDEAILNVSNVNSNQFGLLFTRLVDDQIFAQPLIMTNVNLGTNGTHNIVIVPTANDSIYAFDADDPSITAPYWTNSFLNSSNVVAPTTADFGGCPFFTSHIGIISTPAIDPATETIYLLATTKETSTNGTSIVQRLHALDLTTGLERNNSPVIIAASCPGTNTIDSTNGIVVFNPSVQLQRSGLALVNGTIYIGWASYCDFFNYHGWLMAYDAATLQQIAVYNDTPNGSEGGIWMSGTAPAADTNGNIYISTGNGTVGDPTNATDTINRGESFIKLTLSGTNLDIASWFTPYNWAILNGGDKDLGSAGLVLIPGTSLAFSGGKGGVVYLVDRDNMGGLGSGRTNGIQFFSLFGNDLVYGAPVWWDGPTGSYAYISSDDTSGGYTGSLAQYQFDRTSGKFTLPSLAVRGANLMAILAVSALGTNAGTGVLWVSGALGTDSSNKPNALGILHAYNAQSIFTELWNSEQNHARDFVGDYATFSSPTIANGKVYLATFSDRLDIYGLLPPLLSANLQGGNVVLSWPTNNYPNYVLQFSSDLLSGSWNQVTNNVIATNGAFQVSIPPSAATSFFRLKL